MDFRKMLSIVNENSLDKKPVKKKKVKKTKTLKDWVEQVENHLVEQSNKKVDEVLQTQTPIPVVGKAGDKTSTQAGFLHIDDTSPAGKAMSDALGKLAKDKKAQIVMPTTQQPQQTQQTQQTQQKPGMQPVQQIVKDDIDDNQNLHKLNKYIPQLAKLLKR